MKNEKGVTLVTLVITIVVLIILAGIAINFAMGENGIFRKAEDSRHKYTQEQIKEKISLKIDDIQIEKQGNATLNDLDGLTLEGYDVTVGDIGRLITVTKGSETYIFWVDSNLNITEFDGNISIEDSGNSNYNTSIQEYEPTISNINGTYFTITANATSSESTIVAYEYFVNGEYKGITLANTSNTMNITGLELDTEYEVYIVALDDKGTIRKSTVIKQRTLDREYLIKDGKALIAMSKTNISSITQNEGYSKVVTNTVAARAHYYTTNLIDLANYTSLKVDLELTARTSTSTFSVLLFTSASKLNSTEYVKSAYVVASNGPTAIERKIYTMDLSNTNSQYIITFCKNGNPGKVEYNLYNLWLEK